IGEVKGMTWEYLRPQEISLTVEKQDSPFAGLFSGKQGMLEGKALPKIGEVLKYKDFDKVLLDASVNKNEESGHNFLRGLYGYAAVDSVIAVNKDGLWLGKDKFYNLRLSPLNNADSFYTQKIQDSTNELKLNFASFQGQGTDKGIEWKEEIAPVINKTSRPYYSQIIDNSIQVFSKQNNNLKFKDNVAFLGEDVKDLSVQKKLAKQQEKKDQPQEDDLSKRISALAEKKQLGDVVSNLEVDATVKGDYALAKGKLYSPVNFFAENGEFIPYFRADTFLKRNANWQVLGFTEQKARGVSNSKLAQDLISNDSIEILQDVLLGKGTVHFNPKGEISLGKDSHLGLDFIINKHAKSVTVPLKATDNLNYNVVVGAKTSDLAIIKTKADGALIKDKRINQDILNDVNFSILKQGSIQIQKPFNIGKDSTSGILHSIKQGNVLDWYKGVRVLGFDVKNENDVILSFASDNNKQPSSKQADEKSKEDNKQDVQKGPSKKYIEVNKGVRETPGLEGNKAYEAGLVKVGEHVESALIVKDEEPVAAEWMYKLFPERQGVKFNLPEEVKTAAEKTKNGQTALDARDVEGIRAADNLYINNGTLDGRGWEINKGFLLFDIPFAKFTEPIYVLGKKVVSEKVEAAYDGGDIVFKALARKGFDSAPTVVGGKIKNLEKLGYSLSGIDSKLLEEEIGGYLINDFDKERFLTGQLNTGEKIGAKVPFALIGQDQAGYNISGIQVDALKAGFIYHLPYQDTTDSGSPRLDLDRGMDVVEGEKKETDAGSRNKQGMASLVNKITFADVIYRDWVRLPKGSYEIKLKQEGGKFSLGNLNFSSEELGTVFLHGKENSLVSIPLSGRSMASYKFGAEGGIIPLNYMGDTPSQFGDIAGVKEVEFINQRADSGQDVFQVSGFDKSAETLSADLKNNLPGVVKFGRTDKDGNIQALDLSNQNWKVVSEEKDNKIE
ncbi:MAG: hypothetical protein ABIH18_09695, partial [Candidatus Omnitrophota bacterium]